MGPVSEGPLSESLRDVPLLAGCSPKELRQIAAAGKILPRTAGSQIVGEGKAIRRWQ